VVLRELLPVTRVQMTVCEKTHFEQTVKNTGALQSDLLFIHNSSLLIYKKANFILPFSHSLALLFTG
jgi:uncharacterized membrane protein YwzB